MRAAKAFVDDLQKHGLVAGTSEIRVQLYGSLALTGLGHGTDRAIVMGLAGSSPETVDPVEIGEFVYRVEQLGTLFVAGRDLPFSLSDDIQLCPSELLPHHSNGMRFTALDEAGQPIHEAIYYSVGGGFVVDGEGRPLSKSEPRSPLPYPFQSAAELLAHTKVTGMPISQIAQQNERSFRDDSVTYRRLDAVWHIMQRCVENGCQPRWGNAEYLPGNLRVRRRAPHLYHKLVEGTAKNGDDPLTPLDWVDVFALAVSEENACGGRVVTAPTNGAAGIIPAVLHYYHRFVEGANTDGVHSFLLTAGAIGILYKQNASISGAEVGCQGEVGAACSMAAAGLTEVLGGTPEQVEQAAEIAMEHHLGLTCDPVGGLVQIPCIERNAMAATHAIHASRLALRSDGKHCVSLDKVIETMRQTGADMHSKYKETSQGGLAVNVIEC
jgi:L-serine dehydratase